MLQRLINGNMPQGSLVVENVLLDGATGTEILQVDLQTGAQTAPIPGLDHSHGMIFLAGAEPSRTSPETRLEPMMPQQR